MRELPYHQLRVNVGAFVGMCLPDASVAAPPPSPRCSAPSDKAAAKDVAAKSATEEAAAAAAAAAKASSLTPAEIVSGRRWSAKVLLLSGVPPAVLHAEDYKSFQVCG
jgi:hypothetical protein